MTNYCKPRIDVVDVVLFEEIGRFGFVDLKYILNYYRTNCKDQTRKERLFQLVKHGYLVKGVIVPPRGEQVRYPHGYAVYILGIAGISMVKHYSGIEPKNQSEALLNEFPYRIYHQVQLAHVCKKIKHDYQKAESPFRMDRIYNDSELYIEYVGNIPDAMLCFKWRGDEREKAICVFIEMERSVKKTKTIASKIRNYSLSFSDRLYAKKLELNVASNRVLFVAETDQQYDLLIKKIKSVNSSKDINILVAKYQDLMFNAMDFIYYDVNKNRKIKLLAKMTK
jgi:hypothetical protein